MLFIFLGLITLFSLFSQKNVTIKIAPSLSYRSNIIELDTAEPSVAAEAKVAYL